ncbi:MAG: DUF547 domain-containing protein [Flavobacteriales bacterium]|nr:MAG: DUF547 domain-containing protein [Flavobacteriales bacterium]
MKKLVVILVVLFLSKKNFAMEVTSYVTIVNHTTWNQLLKKHVSDQGKVDYLGFKKDLTELNAYLDWLSNSKPSETWSKDQLMAFWINAYNALTIKLIVDRYPISSIKDIYSPWNIKVITIANKKLSLNNIEHDILRKMGDPRIHFGIVCASISCPKLQNEAFNTQNTNRLLNKASKEFLADSTKNELTTDAVELSKIFKWFAKDFKQEGSLIYFLNKFADIRIASDATISFKDYNWGLNE